MTTTDERNVIQAMRRLQRWFLRLSFPECADSLQSYVTDRVRTDGIETKIDSDRPLLIEGREVMAYSLLALRVEVASHRRRKAPKRPVPILSQTLDFARGYRLGINVGHRQRLLDEHIRHLSGQTIRFGDARSAVRISPRDTLYLLLREQYNEVLVSGMTPGECRKRLRDVKATVDITVELFGDEVFA